MTQPLLPGIEEADWDNGLGKLHDPYIFLDDNLAISVFTWNDFEETYLSLLQNNVKKAVDNET